MYAETHIYICIYRYVYTHVYMYMYAYMHKCAYVYIYIFHMYSHMLLVQRWDVPWSGGLNPWAQMWGSGPGPGSATRAHDTNVKA